MPSFSSYIGKNKTVTKQITPFKRFIRCSVKFLYNEKCICVLCHIQIFLLIQYSHTQNVTFHNYSYCSWVSDIQNIRSCHETNFLLTLGGYNNHGTAKILAFKKHTVKQISSFWSDLKMSTWTAVDWLLRLKLEKLHCKHPGTPMRDVL